MYEHAVILNQNFDTLQVLTELDEFQGQIVVIDDVRTTGRGS